MWRLLPLENDMAFFFQVPMAWVCISSCDTSSFVVVLVVNWCFDGSGKSAICLTTFLFCFARGLPVVYIPKADLWVESSESKADARRYFMEKFFVQNADIIAESSDLAPFFADQLNDEPVSGDAYVKFAEALRSRCMPKCGMIVDEAQKLIESASEQPQTTRDGEVILKKDGSPLMKIFFAADFTIWTSYSGSFCSQLCASSHGLREFTLPSGESHRLRFVTPFSPNTGRSLLQHEDSPFFVKPEDGDADGQTLTANMEAATGWMPRPMQQAAEECRKKGSKAGMDNFKFVRYAEMRYLSDKKWLGAMSTKNQFAALHRIPDLILGKYQFNPLEKQLYDHGVLFVNESGHFQPVSNLAADMLFRMHVEETQTNADPEASFYWRDVEIAVAKAISYSWGKRVPVLSLDGEKTMTIPFGANELKLFVGGTFADASECIVQDEKNTILYIPRDSQFTCDMFLLPPVGSEDPIVVIDVSIADPYSTDRIKKYKRWQELTVVPRLKEKFPSHDVVCVAVWPQEWTAEKARAKILNNFSPENKDALMATYLMDKTGMNNVNIAIKYKD